MRIALLLAALCSVSCSALTGYGDLERGYFVGEWIRVSEVPVGYGAYVKDTTIYRIGLDAYVVPDTIYVNKDKLLSFVIVYPRGGSDYGYLSNPVLIRVDLKITYTWTQLPAEALSQITFKRPTDDDNEIISDTLNVISGTERFGLRRR